MLVSNFLCLAFFSFDFLIEGYMVSEPPQCGRIGRVMLGYPWVMCRGEGEGISDMSRRE